MATYSTCSKLKQGQDTSCLSLKRRYIQQAVFLNMDDIDPATIVIAEETESVPCAHTVQFALKTGKTGYLFRGNENASSFKGYADKTTQETFGNPDYIHHVQIPMAGVDEKAKCILTQLDRGNYVIAMQYSDNTIEIFGMESGLKTDDYTYDPQEGGGGSLIVMSSRDFAPEPKLPFVYKSLVSGGEVADFDDLFAQT